MLITLSLILMFIMIVAIMSICEDIDRARKTHAQVIADFNAEINSATELMRSRRIG